MIKPDDSIYTEKELDTLTKSELNSNLDKALRSMTYWANKRRGNTDEQFSRMTYGVSEKTMDEVANEIFGVLKKRQPSYAQAAAMLEHTKEKLKYKAKIL